MTVAFFPSAKESNNDYTNTVIKAIKIASPDTNIVALPSFWSIIKGKVNFKIAWLNWFEIMPQTQYLFLKSLFLKIIIINILHYKGIKIYTVFHNKTPHESIHPSLNKWFYKFLLKKSDRIIILSDKSKDYINELIGSKYLAKVVKISHPAYEIRKKTLHTNDKFTVLFFGFLRPYKNIELIINLAKENPNINFLIAGKPINDDYLSQLRNNIIPLKNITLIPKFQNENDIQKLIKISTLVILPYNINSSLNSGVLFHSLSNGINVIVPHIASVDEFDNKNLIYSYNYKEEKDHYAKLSETLKRAYTDFLNKPDDFENKALTLQNEVSKFTPQYLASQIKEAHLLEV